MAITLAILSALCFGVGMVTGRIGLRTLDPRAGAAISIPTATVLFLAAAPFAIEWSAFNLSTAIISAAIIFALVGMIYPAVVTLLTFRANEELGPTVTSAISGTAPLFALLAAGLFLDERVPPQAAVAAAGVALGTALLSWTPDAIRAGFTGKALLWPIAGAVLRGLAQAGAKAGLLLWPNPFAAGVIGYVVSSATVIGADRMRHAPRIAPARRSVLWFGATGILNGGAMLLMYAALAIAPVSTVAPIIAAYPLVTVGVSALFLRGDTLTWRMVGGAIITVAAIVYLSISRI